MHCENPLEIFPCGAPPSPREIRQIDPPSPSPLENPILSVGVVWIFSGTKQYEMVLPLHSGSRGVTIHIPCNSLIIVFQFQLFQFDYVNVS